LNESAANKKNGCQRCTNFIAYIFFLLYNAYIMAIKKSDIGQRVIQLNGIYPPVPTPFDSEGRIAPEPLKKNLAALNRYELRGYVILGTNGEYVMLTEQEKLWVLDAARQAIPRERLLIAGTGCQSTGETIDLTHKAAELGADAALVITPYYYKKLMTPGALITHYNTVADMVPIPVLIYNMPACTGIDLDEETIAAMARHPNIIGIKESSGNVVKMATIRQKAGPGFQVLAGSAGFLLPALSIGAVGGVPALANIAPEQCIDIHRYFLEGKRKEARDLQVRLAPLNTAVTARWGVPALKAAMDMMGLYGGPVRLPLLPIDDDTRKQLEAVIMEGGIK
jgi:4-hydroxy-2-oxoglutarate aldolase